MIFLFTNLLPNLVYKIQKYCKTEDNKQAILNFKNQEKYLWQAQPNYSYGNNSKKTSPRISVQEVNYKHIKMEF